MYKSKQTEQKNEIKYKNFLTKRDVMAKKQAIKKRRI